MKTYVINLTRSRQRRKRTIAELEKHGLDYEIVTAIDGRHMSEEEFVRIPVADTVKGNRYYTRSIIATALSHAEVYKRILESGDPLALVIEDDVEFCKGFKGILANIADDVGQNEVVLCHFMSTSPLLLSAINCIDLQRNYRLCYPIDFSHVSSGAAYVITREAARSLLDIVVPVQSEADSWKRFFDQRGFASIRFVCPMPVSARGEKSTIAAETQSIWRRSVTSLVHEYRIPPFYQILRALRLASISSRSKVVIVEQASSLAPAKPSL